MTDLRDLEDADEIAAMKAAAAGGVDSKTEARTREAMGAALSKNAAPRYVEDCPKCWGTGVWRHSRDCFKCKGTGKLKFRTSPEARQAAKERARRKKTEKRSQAAEWLKDNPERAAFLKQSWSFPQDLADKLARYGSLTTGQVEAIDRCLKRQAERRKASESEIDLSQLLPGYYAVPEGETRLKVRVSRPRKGRWAGFTFVDDGAAYGQRQKYGVQRPGGTYAGKAQEALKAILADPKAAAASYGKLVGVCGVCGRKLEDEKSVELGIGPVCANKF